MNSLSYSLLPALLTGLVLAVPVTAQDKPVVDLSITVVKEPAGVTPTGSFGTLTLIVTNVGPDTAGTIPPNTHWPLSVLTDLQADTFQYGPAVEFYSLGGDAGCGPFLKGFAEPPLGEYVPDVSYLLAIAQLTPGESLTCRVSFHINAREVGNVVHGWSIRSFNDNDIDPTNNRATVVYNLGLGPTEIPTLSTAGLALLALGLATAFIVLLRLRTRTP